MADLPHSFWGGGRYKQEAIYSNLSHQGFMVEENTAIVRY